MNWPLNQSELRLAKALGELPAEPEIYEKMIDDLTDLLDAQDRTIEVLTKSKDEREREAQSEGFLLGFGACLGLLAVGILCWKVWNG